MLHCLGETIEDGHSKAKISLFHLLSARVPGFAPSKLPEGGGGGGRGVETRGYDKRIVGETSNSFKGLILQNS